MTKKKINFNISWWLDFNILNLSATSFKYSLLKNIYILTINPKFLYYFFLLNKKNTNTLNFYVLDITTYSNLNKNYYFLAYQSIFYDFKILIQTEFKKTITSISSIYSGSVWLERETKEFNSIQYTNLLDTRKLLSNYNYNQTIQYNNYNNIINDLKL